MESLIEQLQVVVSNLNRRVSDLEKDSHPAIGLSEFEGFKELLERIEKLESNLKDSSNG